MKIYNPLFSIFIIALQLILSLKDYYKLQEWKIANPELDSLANLVVHYDTLFLFVLIIGVYEILTKPSWFKNLIRVFLAGIVLGYQFSGLIPIEGFKFGVYNTAWFSAVASGFLILIKIGEFNFRNKNDKKLNKVIK